MKTYPGAVFKPLGPQAEPTMTGHDVLCLHTMVGVLASTDGYFRHGNGEGYAGTESHYGVGGKWGKDAALGLDGTVWQWQDRRHEADANLDGRHRVISIETADNFPASAADIEPWTPLQCEAISQLLAWESTVEAHADCPPSWTCHREGIPLALIPDTLPGRRGVGYHQQGCDPWRVSGGVLWSPSRGKVCPGARRIAQIPAVIARAIEITQGDDMTAEQAAQLQDIHDRQIPLVHAALQATLASVGAQVATLAAAVQAVGAGQPIDPAVLTAAAEAGARKVLADIGQVAG